MTDSIEQIIAEEIEASEIAETDARLTNGRHVGLPAGTKLTRGHNRSYTLQVRLNEDEHEALERLAKMRELPVSTVARSILLSAITPAGSQAEALKQLEVAFEQVRRFVDEG